MITLFIIHFSLCPKSVLLLLEINLYFYLKKIESSLSAAVIMDNFLYYRKLYLVFRAASQSLLQLFVR